MTIGAYQEPEWAVHPSSAKWTLTEIKAGVEVAKHDLTRSTTILGRAVDIVHVALHHQSISRQHARISFDSNGTPWLRDMQSAHGTYVNKRKLPSIAIGKTESNSHQTGARGIVLSVGDVLKFGASSRYFSLEGPPPKATEQEQNLAKLNASVSGISEPAKNTSNAAASSSPKDDGISWGIDMGGDNDREDGKGGAGDIITSRKSIELDPEKIPEKYRKELDKINGMKYKLANLETEDGRIRRKGGSELTDGQQKQLNRNAEKETVLRKSIQEREERLHDKLNPNSGDASSKRKRATNSYDDEDDDFFDRTKTDSSISDFVVEEAESEESLRLKWKKLVGERKHITTTLLAKANHRVETLRTELKSMQASGNEEAFFVQNDLQLAVESKKKIDLSLTRTNATLDEIEKLLNVVNPKLNCDRSVGYIGQGQPPKQKITTTERNDKSHSSTPAFPMPAPKKIQKTAPAPMGPPATFQKKKLENKSMPPPPSMSTDSSPSMPPPPPMRSVSQTMVLASSSTDSSTANKRKRILGPAAVPSSKALVEGSNCNQPPSKTTRTGTLSFLDHSTKTSKAGNDETIPSTQIKSVQLTKERGPKKPYLQASVDASMMDAWRAPDGQDGSGKTKLNEKFAGRY